MINTGSYEKSHATALKVIEYLGLMPEDIRNKYRSSLYITYSYNGKTYELRISDHCANPTRLAAKKMIFGYATIELGHDWDIAKRTIDREIFGKKEMIINGTKVNHPAYGEGITIAHDIEKDKLDIDFNGMQKSFFATIVIDRGWVSL